MKAHVLFIAVTLLCIHHVNGQIVTIPDPGFVNFLNNNGFAAALSGNQLDTQHQSVQNAMTINCNNAGISDLDGIQYFTNLHALMCDNNFLNSLPSLVSLTTLNTLACSHNILFSLPALPSSINDFHCDDNQLYSLPTLPSSLVHLYCNDNPLTSLPALPPNLLELVAYNTLLTSLPALPNLDMLICNNSMLTTLPNLPAGLSIIDVSGNQLTSITNIPFNVSINIRNNPNLLCLPRMPQIMDMIWDSTGITCMPNYFSCSGCYPLMNSVPLCDVYNVNGCSFYYNIAGQVYRDANTNCLKDPGEAALNTLKVNLYQGATLLQQVLTVNDGLYNIEVPYGTYDYSVDTVGKPFIVNCPVSGFRTSVISALDSTDMDMDFGLQCVPGFDVGIHTIAGSHFLPGDTGVVNTIAGDMSRLYNMNCASGVSGTLQITFSGPVTFVSAAPGSLVPVVTPNTLTYNISNFGLVSPYTSFNFYIATDTSAQIGDTVCFSANITPVSGDFIPSNNQYNVCFTVVNSFDPNDKQVYPSGEISQNQQWLTYNINFQNTGNAPAQHIVVTDTLDANLQEGTFTFLTSSHEANISVTGNIVKFIFPNINLPDSVNNEPDSHGYVQFKLKPVTTLVPGDSIQNTAAIYFDFNSPVITNTVINRVGLPLSVQELTSGSIKVFPNPANDELNLVTTFNSFEYELVDLIGRIVMRGNLIGTANNIGISTLQSGCYILKVKKDSMQLVEKVNVY